MRQTQREVRKRVANINSQLENSLSGVRVAKAFANEEYEKDRFQEGNREFRVAKKASYKYMAIFQTGLDSLGNVLNITVLIVGGIFFLQAAWDAAGYPGVYAVYLVFMQPVRRLSNFAQQFETGMTGFERFTEILDTDPDIQDKPGALELKKVKGDIAFENVTFSYSEGEAKILHHINLAIPEGKTLALVGPSGGGKTTLCHLIPRFYEIDGGQYHHRWT